MIIAGSVSIFESTSTQIKIEFNWKPKPYFVIDFVGWENSYEKNEEWKNLWSTTNSQVLR